MKVLTLNNKRFKETCLELVSKFNLEPDIVIYILNGGRKVINEIKNETNFKKAHFQSVKLNSNYRLENCFLVTFILRILPYSITNKLRIIKSHKVEKAIQFLNLDDLSKQNIKFSSFSNIDKEVKNILIVDDAIDSGKSMFKVKNKLHNHFPEARVKTAVISWTLEKSIVKPDYFIFKNVLVRFPWSKDYKGKDFE